MPGISTDLGGGLSTARYIQQSMYAGKSAPGYLETLFTTAKDLLPLVLYDKNWDKLLVTDEMTLYTQMATATAV